jgi:N-acetylneuraminate synthase
LIVGEVAQAHDGSLGFAHAFIDAIAAAGADAVKFQTHIAAAESTPEEPWRVSFSKQDATRYDYWKRMEFTEDQWLGLRQHAHDRGLWFVCSPFSVEAVELLMRVGIDAWKIASGETGHSRLHNAVLGGGLPVLLSSGMSTLEEVDAVVTRIAAAGVPLGVLQCTTAYPCPPGEVGLNLLAVFRERYRAPVGLSDHSGTIYPGLAAVALGADIVEVHVTLSRQMFGPDVAASVTMEELRQLTEGARMIEAMLASPVDKNAVARRLAPLRTVFSRSIVARVDLPAGTVLQEAHLALRKPGSGMPESALERVLGRRLKVSLSANAIIREEHLE